MFTKRHAFLPLSPRLSLAWETARRLALGFTGFLRVVRSATDIQSLVSHDLFQPTVFIFQCLQPLQFTDGEPGVLGLTVVVGGITHPVLAAEIADLGSRLSLPEHSDDPLFSVPSTCHVESSYRAHSGGELQFRLLLFSGVRSIRA